ncbi:MAG: SH3 domain-containing protein [Rhodobacter sp.]|nr:SH3 domain-containing protein [Rhodobacter sp.]
MCGLKGALVVAALALAGPAMAEPMVVGGSSALRAGPDPLYLAETTLPHGARVDVIERSAGWAMVRVQSGGVGWIKASALVAPGQYRTARADSAKPREWVARAAPMVDVPHTSVVWPSSGNLNLRSGPGTVYDVVRPMQRGDWVEVQDYAGAWVRLRHPSGDEGWAYRAYLTR